jgi:hypothetical protein
VGNNSIQVDTSNNMEDINKPTASIMVRDRMMRWRRLSRNSCHGSSESWRNNAVSSCDVSHSICQGRGSIRGQHSALFLLGCLFLPRLFEDFGLAPFLMLYTQVVLVACSLAPSQSDRNLNPSSALSILNEKSIPLYISFSRQTLSEYFNGFYHLLTINCLHYLASSLYSPSLRPLFLTNSDLFPAHHNILWTPFSLVAFHFHLRIILT